MATQHFLTLLDIDPADLSAIINRAAELKSLHKAGKPHEILKGRVLGMIFEKSSTRTRVAFEAGMAQLGGSAIFLSPTDTQLGRGEPVEDTARVLSEMVDVVMIRAADHAMVERFAEYSSVPVINALTDRYHPCQLLADMQTYRDNRGDIAGRTVTWVGDGFNMCNSFINASRQFGFHLRVACPEGYDPDPELMHANANTVTLVRDPREAVTDSDLVVTDVWSSMGHEAEQAQRKADFADYQVAPSLMDLARPDALFMHCLPAHRGEEVSEDMLDDPRSVVFEEAGNRLHTQKALLEYLVG